MNHIKWTIVSGNPVNGFELYGVFDTQTAAIQWAETDGHIDDGDWWIAPINPLP